MQGRKGTDRNEGGLPRRQGQGIQGIIELPAMVRVQLGVFEQSAEDRPRKPSLANDGFDVLDARRPSLKDGDVAEKRNGMVVPHPIVLRAD